MSKHFLLSASVIALFTSPSFATKQAAIDLADRESNQQALIKKLTDSNNYTIDLDEEREAERIKDAVLVLNPNDRGKKLNSSDISNIKFEAKRRIANNLESAKNSNAVFNGKRLTKNLKQGVLSVGDTYVPTVYPVFKRDREGADAFLPLTYRDSYTYAPGSYPINEALWQEIKTYSYGRGLKDDQAKRLYHYLEPLFFLVQEEVGKMVTGLQTKTAWVHGSREDMTTLLKGKTDHHTTIISNAGLSGFNPDQVKNWLTPRLLDKVFSLLPDPMKELYRADWGVYKLGVNVHNKISMIHPITELPYPIFTEDRGQADWNLPKNYRPSSILNKQWDRVHDFVRLHDGIKTEEQSRVINLLEPVGYFFHKQLENFHVRGGDLPDPEMGTDRIIFMARMFADLHTIFQPYLDIFYDGNVDVHSALQNVQVKNKSHVILTGNLWPQRLVDRKEPLANGLLNYLMFKDIVDRFKIFYPDKARELDSMSVALN